MVVSVRVSSRVIMDWLERLVTTMLSLGVESIESSVLNSRCAPWLHLYTRKFRTKLFSFTSYTLLKTIMQ